MKTSSSPMDDRSVAARLAAAEAGIVEPLRAALRGVGQVFFQGNALTGACFIAGLAVSSPLMATGALAGSAMGLAVARAGKFDRGEIADGIYGFNAALVGIASFFFFQPGVASVLLMIAGAILATILTRLMRKSLPFPTYTTPFIVTTWALWLCGRAIGLEGVAPGGPLAATSPLTAAAHGISQVMFQASVPTALLFVLGIALSEWRHAAWVGASSVLGVIAANYHATPEQSALDPERLITRFLPENIGLGLYSYNATLAALALYLRRKSLITPLFGALLTVPIAEFAPRIGLPALTAPFVLATWIVLLLGWIDARFLHPTSAE